MTQTADAGSGLSRLRITENERQPKRHRRRWPYVTGGLILLGAAIGLLSRPVEVQVAAAHSGGKSPADEGGSVLTANGYIEARHQASVAARTTGRLAAVLVEEGDKVDSNQVVARLIDDDQRAAVAQAQANLALARARVEQAAVAETDAARRNQRRQTLLAEKQVSAEESESAATVAESARAERVAAEANVHVAQATLDAARLELEKTRITAPFAGVVLRKDAEVGEIVGPIMTSSTARAGAVVTIADMRTLEVGVDINESYIARLHRGQAADVVLDAYPEVHFPSEVRAIYPSADRDKATIPVRIRFLVEDERIRPDLGAKVTFLEHPTGREIVTVRKILRVPRSAVRTRGTEQLAWVVKTNKVAPAVVTLGEVAGDEVEVLTGLSEGDQVVVGGNHLRPGMRVRTKTGK